MISVWNVPHGQPQPDLQPLVDLACSLGSERFPSALLNCLGHWVDSQHFSVLRMDEAQPGMLLAGTRHADAQLVWRCWQAYSRQFHSHDQLFQRMRRQRRQTGQTGQTLVGHLLAEDIEFGPYRQAIYHSNGMSERLSSLHWGEDGVPVLFNLYRHRENGYFSDREIGVFEQLTPALLRLLEGHLALRRERGGLEDWRRVLLRKAPGMTSQEQEVCLHLLQGMTHAGIGAAMGLRESTVKTYRNRAFARLGISFRSQLFALLRS
jgi:DNA-binding CsgD family transcriptional regulator